jgi:hypothetical protein
MNEVYGASTAGFGIGNLDCWLCSGSAGCTSCVSFGNQGICGVVELQHVDDSGPKLVGGLTSATCGKYLSIASQT